MYIYICNNLFQYYFIEYKKTQYNEEKKNTQLLGLSNYYIHTVELK